MPHALRRARAQHAHNAARLLALAAPAAQAARPPARPPVSAPSCARSTASAPHHGLAPRCAPAAGSPAPPTRTRATCCAATSSPTAPSPQRVRRYVRLAPGRRDARDDARAAAPAARRAHVAALGRRTARVLLSAPLPPRRASADASAGWAPPARVPGDGRTASPTLSRVARSRPLIGLTIGGEVRAAAGLDGPAPPDRPVLRRVLALPARARAGRRPGRRRVRERARDRRPRARRWACSSSRRCTRGRRAHEWLVDAASWMYVNSHFTITTVTLAWLYLRRNERFYCVRNMFMVAMGIALVGYVVFPTAPPRFMPELGFADPVAEFTGRRSRVERALQPVRGGALDARRVRADARGPDGADRAPRAGSAALWCAYPGAGHLRRHRDRQPLVVRRLPRRGHGGRRRAAPRCPRG